MTQPLPDRLFTLSEYLAIEPEGNVRHEFVNGELIAMTGTSRAHNSIAGNLIAAIRPALRGTLCRIASADMKVVSVEAARGYYPNVVVSFSDPAEEPDEHTETHPLLVIEILSPSTESFDRGDKCVHYRRIDSLQEYLIVAQSAQAIERHARSSGSWSVTSYGPDETVPLTSIGIELPMSIVYEDVFELSARLDE